MSTGHVPVLVVAHNPLRFGSWGVIVILWVEKTLHKLPTKLLTMNNTIRLMFQTLSVLAILTELIVDLAVSVIAFVIVVSEYTYEIAQIVYTDRHNILAKVNQTRNDLGSYFVYAA